MRRATATLQGALIGADSDARRFVVAAAGLLEGDVHPKLLRKASRQVEGLLDADALFREMQTRPSVFVCGGSLTQEGTPEFARAEQLGYQLALAGFLVIHGGGPGNMEAVARGAERATRRRPDIAVPSIGFALQLPTEQKVSPSLRAGRFVVLEDLPNRQWLCGQATHTIVTEGGVGTFYELYEHLVGRMRQQQGGVLLGLNSEGSQFFDEQFRAPMRGMAAKQLIRPGEHIVPMVMDDPGQAVHVLRAYGLLQDGHEWADERTLRVRMPGGKPLTSGEWQSFQQYFNLLRADLPKGSPLRSADVQFLAEGTGAPYLEVTGVEKKQTHLAKVVEAALVHAAMDPGIGHSHGLSATDRMFRPGPTWRSAGNLHVDLGRSYERGSSSSVVDSGRTLPVPSTT